jgi:hypothetical protein
VEEKLPQLTVEVSVDDLRRILPPLNELDYVETCRLTMVRRHVLNLLDESFPTAYRPVEEVYLGHLGATEVLEYLP